MLTPYLFAASFSLMKTGLIIDCKQVSEKLFKLSPKFEFEQSGILCLATPAIMLMNRLFHFPPYNVSIDVMGCYSQFFSFVSFAILSTGAELSI